MSSTPWSHSRPAWRPGRCSGSPGLRSCSMKSTPSRRSSARSLPPFEPIVALLKECKRLPLMTCPFCRGSAGVTAGVGTRASGEWYRDRPLDPSNLNQRHVWARVACVECGAERLCSARMSANHPVRSVILRSIRMWNTRSARIRRLLGQRRASDLRMLQSLLLTPWHRRRVAKRLRTLKEFQQMDPETQMALCGPELDLLSESPSFNKTPINLP